MLDNFIISDLTVLKTNSINKKPYLNKFEWLEKLFFRFLKNVFFVNKVSIYSFFVQSLNYNSFKLNQKKNTFNNIFLDLILAGSKNNPWISSKAFFFCEFKIVGLGFKIKKGKLENLRILKLDLGYGHFVKYPLPFEVKCIIRKKKFLLFSYNILLLNFVIKHLQELKPLNPYKIRGLRNTKKVGRKKEGKKQSQR